MNKREKIFKLLKETRGQRKSVRSMPRQIKAGLILRSSLNNLTATVEIHDAVMDSLNPSSDYRSVREAHKIQMDKERRAKESLKNSLEEAFEAKDWGDASPYAFLNRVFCHSQDAVESALFAGFTVDPR